LGAVRNGFVLYARYDDCTDARPGRLRLAATYWTLLTDGAENRRLLAAGPLRTVVLVVGAGAHGATDPAAALRPHLTDVTGAVAPTGHFVAEEAPEWLVAELRRFLAEHQG
jgi:hypothetical protein